MTRHPIGSQPDVAEWFAFQAEACRDLGSALWGAALDRLSIDVREGGPTWSVVQSKPDRRLGDLVALRIMGLAHRMALSGRAPALAAALPSCGGTADAETAAIEVQALIAERPDEFEAALRIAPQTNEVGRAGALIVGLGWASRRFGLPLALREIGCSAGLNLRLDHFHYDSGTDRFGPPSSPVQITHVWEGDPGFGDVRVIDRAGCDPNPVDVDTAEGATWIESFVWPDQTARIARLRGAIALARQHPARVESTTRTADWVAGELAGRPVGATTVLFHSIVWQYIDKPDRVEITRAIETAGATASTDRPLVWLQFEPDPDDRTIVAVTARSWPGDIRVRLASAGFHGQWVRVLA